MSGDLDSFVAEFNLDTKPATQRLDVFSSVPVRRNPHACHDPADRTA